MTTFGMMICYQDDLKVWPFFNSISYIPGWWMNAFTEEKQS